MIGARRNNTFQIGIKGSPAGGGYSTVHDLLRFDIALQNNIFLSPDNSRRVLRPVNAKASSQPRVIILAGGTAGVAAYYVKYPRSDHIVIILSNYDPDDVQAVEEQIRNMLLST